MSPHLRIHLLLCPWNPHHRHTLNLKVAFAALFLDSGDALRINPALANAGC